VAQICESYRVEDEREFDYVKGREKGPRHSGEILDEWAPCKNGGMQSPIDLSSRRAVRRAKEELQVLQCHSP
jgi:carbonic anhydrase